VTGGTRNGSGTLVVRVTSVAAQSVLARLQQLVEDAQRDKAPLQRIADRISSIFVPAVLMGAAVTFLTWWLVIGNLGKAVLSALAVLLVACPCAMGLAAPVAMMVGCGRAAALGIFIRSGDILERLASVDQVVFDKTGTLTERHAQVTMLVTIPSMTPDELVALAAAVESENDHPIATAITARADDGAPVEPVRAEDVRTVPGEGVTGVVGGRKIRVSRLTPDALPASIAVPVAEHHQRGETVVVVTADGAVLGAIAVTTPLRAEAAPAVSRLRAIGLPSAILSGDSEPAVRVVADELGIDTARSALSPADKVAAVSTLVDQGHRVLMVGDGVNDAPALAAAEVGIAMGTGTDVAIESAGLTLLKGDLMGIVRARRLSAATMSNIRQNLLFAFMYNAAGEPIAAGVLYPMFGILLSPIMGAAAMALSSVSVVGNALRLRHVKL
jgi:Cu+-exporting ATPase